MQEHPVPQNITSYEFHLIGNMTLKQFFELATGGLIAFMIYSSNLPQLLKIPLILIFVLLGVAFAFVPLEERPLDGWLLAFMRAIYNPTKFYWKKTIKVPDLFSYASVSKRTDAISSALPRKHARAEAYFQSIGTKQQEEPEELLQRAADVMKLYDSTPAAGPISQTRTQQPVDKPNLQVGMHSLHAMPQHVPTTMPEPATPIEEPKPQFVNPPDVVIVPQQKNITVERTEKPVVVFNKPIDVAIKSDSTVAFRPTVQQPAMQRASDTAIPAQTSTSLPFPKTPTTPNLVVGMVLDTNGKIVENSIIEIRDSGGVPVRALRSNKLGQFFISTPLPAGEYEIDVEKEGQTFDTMTLTLKNSIVDPLEIRAKSTT